jgi:hypothetical protein
MVALWPADYGGLADSVTGPPACGGFVSDLDLRRFFVFDVLDHLARFDAGSADRHLFRLAVHQRIDRLEIGHPATRRDVMGMGYPVTENRRLPANVTYFCHQCFRLLRYYSRLIYKRGNHRQAESGAGNGFDSGGCVSRLSA